MRSGTFVTLTCLPEMQTKRRRCPPHCCSAETARLPERDAGGMILPAVYTSALPLFCPVTWDRLNPAGPLPTAPVGLAG